MYYFIFCQEDIYLTPEGNIPFGKNSPFPIEPWNLVTTLPYKDTQAQVIHLAQPLLGEASLTPIPLRKSAEVLSPDIYQFAGKCRELFYWHQQTKYCGMCGSPLQWNSAISKQCPECGKEWWPSLAIAIIVRVEKGDQILMTQSKNFRGPFYGLVAGFVETGETLEECVAREVKEETGIAISEIRYYGSQPWPYPCGLMVGFTAQYEAGEICVDRKELKDANWFSIDNLPTLPATGSIARTMIEDWVKKKV